jgi:hypothetical protein
MYTHYVGDMIDVDYIDTEGMGGWSDTYNYNDYYREYMEHYYNDDHYYDNYDSSYGYSNGGGYYYDPYNG